MPRSSFGRHGAHIATLTRAAVGIMWLSYGMWLVGTLGMAEGIGVATGDASAFVNWGPLWTDGETVLLSTTTLLFFLGFAAFHWLVLLFGVHYDSHSVAALR